MEARHGFALQSGIDKWRVESIGLAAVADLITSEHVAAALHRAAVRVGISGFGDRVEDRPIRWDRKGTTWAGCPPSLQAPILVSRAYPPQPTVDIVRRLAPKTLWLFLVPSAQLACAER